MRGKGAKLQPDTQPRPNSDTAIEIENLVVSYGKKQVLNGLSLIVPRGSIFGFLGANGAGKTTTIKTLLGFRAPNGGTAHVLGYDVVRQHEEICERTGYVSEISSLYEYMSIPQICAFCQKLQRSWNQELVDHYLTLFALPKREKVGRLSKGMKSQLALCLALGHDPDLLILDEPTTGLDPIARQLFLNTLVSDIAAAGKTIFFSSHILSEIEAISDRVGVLRQGRVVLNDELDHLRASQKMLRIIYTHIPPASEINVLGSLPGVMRVDQEGRNVRLRINGDTAAVATRIQERPYELRDIETLNVHLEDVLIDSIRGENHVY